MHDASIIRCKTISWAKNLARGSQNFVLFFLPGFIKKNLIYIHKEKNNKRKSGTLMDKKFGFFHMKRN
jgi:hypothetical protein